MTEASISCPPQPIVPSSASSSLASEVQQRGLSTTRISPYAHRRSFLQGYIRFGEDLDGTIAQAKSLAQGLALQNQFLIPLLLLKASAGLSLVARQAGSKPATVETRTENKAKDIKVERLWEDSLGKGTSKL